MELVLLIVYICVLIAEAALLIKAVRRPERKRWVKLYVFEIVALLVAVVLASVFDRLPGYGFLPGLVFVEELFYSKLAAYVLGVILAITVAANVIVAALRKTKRNCEEK